MSVARRVLAVSSALILPLVMLFAPMASLRADLRSAPIWYDQNAVNLAPDWHYRVPITVPAGTPVNATIRADVDFASLLTTMGISGTFDINSPRVVRSTGALATTQEYTDRVFGGATDLGGNNRGEVRFILQDAGAVTYYLYFDITQNGIKAANPQAPINGNFEKGATGTAAPSGWIAPTKSNANFNAEVRPSETVSVTANPAPAADGVNTRNTDGTPNSGAFSYLLGWRNSTAAQVNAAPGVTFTRTIIVPATNPGNLSFRYRVEGWDSYDLGTGYDFLRADLVGTTTTEMVGPTAGSYNTKPFSPNYGAAVASNTASGYRRYNGYDCTLTGTRTNGGTIACGSETWITVTQSLSAYAGQTITLRFRAFTETQDISWYHIDDIEWSVVNATLGAPQGFGINITAPAPTPTYTPGQVVPVTVQVDASPAAASSPMTVALFNAGGTQIAGPFLAFNDGTHGDVTAGDAIWSNNGSIGADAVRVPLSAPTGSGYIIRAFGRDASTSIVGAQNGLVRGPGSGSAAETQTNYYNIDEMLFSVATAAISLSKTSNAVSDPINGTTNPKMIPGGIVRYCLLVSNAGPMSASNIILTDSIPANLTYQPGTMKSGATCATATTGEDDDNSGTDESDPIGSSFSSGTIITITSTVANGGTVALVFDVLVN